TGATKEIKDGAAAGRGGCKAGVSRRSAAGCPVQAPFVRWVGSRRGVPDALGVHGIRCRGPWPVPHGETVVLARRVGTRRHASRREGSRDPSTVGRHVLGGRKSILSPPPLAPFTAKGGERRRGKNAREEREHGGQLGGRMPLAWTICAQRAKVTKMPDGA